MSNDKVSSARNGMGQMAMYLYQAYRDEKLSEIEAKEKVAEEIEKLHAAYNQQAGLDRKIPKSAVTQLEQLQQAINEIELPGMAITKKILANQVSSILMTIKKG